MDGRRADGRSGRRPSLTLTPLTPTADEMTLTITWLHTLSETVYLCDRRGARAFEERVLPTLATLSEGELGALAGMLFDRDLDDKARFVLAYARVGAKLGHPADPAGLWGDWQRERAVWVENEEIPF